ncbi:hypothetical protein DDW44_05560 [Streptomyces tirandamycinicus]|uniref:DUF2975 domain-containing protein n=2 Tax=Streptomyces tirandamycinicus TaxID=2174846 RepID=A0A2S1SPI5_9ACTN|nr:hypothetical protein DDW44_05560 [Streptomyces tirandamycinicus]
MVMAEDRKLLEPFHKTVSGFVLLLVGLLLIAVAFSLVNQGVPFWTAAENCVTADWIGGSSSAVDAIFGTRPGARVSVMPEYCTEDPSAYQRLLGLLTDVPSLILLICGLLVLNRLLRSAARDGVYTEQVAARLRLLGWLLLIGSLVAEIAQAIGRAALLATLTKDVAFSPDTVVSTMTAPYLVMLTGLGLLTFARIMNVGAAMREDLEGTV